MAVKTGKLNAGISLFGIFIKSKLLSRLPIFSPVYAVSVKGKNHRLSKHSVSYADKSLQKATGKEVEIIVSNGDIFGIRAAKGFEFPIDITCYIPAPDMAFDDKIRINAQQYMIRTLIENQIVNEEAANDFKKWLPGA